MSTMAAIVTTFLVAFVAEKFLLAICRLFGLIRSCRRQFP